MKWKRFWFGFSDSVSDWSKEVKAEKAPLFTTTKGKITIALAIVILVAIIIGIIYAQGYFEVRNYRNKARVSMEGKFYKEALVNYEALAQKGDMEGLYKTAEMYLEGLGTPKDQKKALSYLKIAAEAGNSDAQTKLGKLYYSSSYSNRTCLGHNYKQAFEWFKKAGNNPDALEAIATMYQYGLGMPVDEKLAQSYYDQWINVYFNKAKDGDAYSQYLLGLYFIDGSRHPIDEAKALEWLEKSAKQKYVPALELLGSQYLMGGETFGPNVEKAKDIYGVLIGIYESQIAKGDTDAMISLSQMYSNGIGVDQNYQKAMEYLLMASGLGSYTAKDNLVYLAENEEITLPEGITVKSLKDESKDIKVKIATDGDISMMRQLGYDALTKNVAQLTNAETLQFDGVPDLDGDKAIEIRKSMEKSQTYLQEAIKWFTMASEAGDVVSMVELGQIYSGSTDDNIKSLSLAEVWFVKSAEQCYEPSYLELGKLYAMPDTQLENAKNSQEWYKKAAMQGNIEAQLILARSLASGGKGAQPNYYEALVWLLVVKNGYESQHIEDSKEYRELLDLERQYAHYLTDKEIGEIKEKSKGMTSIYGSNW